MPIDEYDVAVTGADGDECFKMFVRHRKGEPGHKDVTLCGVEHEDLALYRANQSDMGPYDQETPLYGIPLSPSAVQLLINDLWYFGARPLFDNKDQLWRWPDGTRRKV